MAAAVRGGFGIIKVLRPSQALLRLPLRNYSSSSDEEVTHTGQQFSERDFRKVRFVDHEKQVNNQFAINLIAEEPPKEVEGRVVACNGGGGALGHPKVYINLDQAGPHACGYCGLRFVKKSGHH